VLARYRLVFDFTRDKMTWTPLAFDPPPPATVGSGAPGGMEAIGTAMKTLGSILGKRSPSQPAPRGFLGMELADGDGGVRVKAVLAGGPAAGGGVRAGDRLTHFQGEAVKTSGDVHRLAAKLTAGETIRLTVGRDGRSTVIAVKAGEGL
jgi:S1-C subfamily serine protease